MKKTTLLLMPLIAAALLQACSGSRVASDADSLTTAEMDAIAAMPNVNAVDSAFAAEAAQSSLAEIELGKMAAERSTNADVKSFGNMMVKDHTAANEELKALAQEKKLMLPTLMDGPSQEKRDVMRRLSGVGFDKAYIDEMVIDHQIALTLMKNEASDGVDADLKAFAAKTAEVIKQHLDEALKMQAKMQ